MGEPGFGFYRNVFAFQDTLVRCLGWLIPFEGLILDTFFCNPLDRWLKAVEVES